MRRNKFYDALAKAIKGERPSAVNMSASMEVQWNCDMLAVARTLEQFHPTFNYNYFCSACRGEVELK